MRTELHSSAAATLILALLLLGPAASGQVRVDHSYNLSDFSGTIPYNLASLHVDHEFDEIYVVYQNVIRIFNSNGMATFSVEYPESGVVILDLSVVNGDLFTLVRRDRAQDDAGKFAIEHRNFRGELISTHEITGRAGDAPELLANRIFSRSGELLVVDNTHMRVTATDLQGRVIREYDLAAVLEISDADAPGVQIVGFDVDPAGNMLMTIPVLFRAYIVSPSGDVRGFGKAGSLPGTFGIVAGIAGDPQGRVFVADRLRSVVMMFDADLQFVTEFGGRGFKPENLIGPSELAVGNKGKVYVTQRRNRGIAVFSVNDTASSGRSSDQARERREVGDSLIVNSFQLTSDSAAPAANRHHPVDALDVVAGRIAQSTHVKTGTLAERASLELHEEEQ